MYKKILCLALTFVVLMCMAVMNVSAANSDTDSKIYFSVPEEIAEVGYVYCFIREYGAEEPLAPWQSKSTLCLKENTGVYSYDTNKVGGLGKDTYYSVIMSLSNGSQTVEMLLSEECLGDTLVGTVKKDTTPSDSGIYIMDATWTNQNADVYGEIKSVNTLGQVIGDCLPPQVTSYELFEDFMVNDYKQVKETASISDQELIDNVAISLGINSDSIEECIKENKIETQWTKEASKAMKADESATADSKDSVSTGQERTIVYISVAMMFVSAGVIFFARKNRLATVSV